MPLVLTRKKNERIVINGNIIIEVNKIKNSRVELAFTFPDTCSVLREEVIIQKEDQKMKAYDDYYDDCELCNAIPLTYDEWSKNHE